MVRTITLAAAAAIALAACDSYVALPCASSSDCPDGLACRRPASGQAGVCCRADFFPSSGACARGITGDGGPGSGDTRGGDTHRGDTRGGDTRPPGDTNSGDARPPGDRTPACTDDCTIPTRECFGEGTRECGQHDADPCSDWGAEVPCTVEALCEMPGATCVATMTWTAPPPQPIDLVSDIWVHPSGIAWAVGNSGNVMRFGGTTWTHLDIDSTINLKGICGFDTDDVWAVGSSPTTTAVFAHRAGGTWSIESYGTEAPFDIACLPSGEAWAVGNRGTIWRYTAPTWTEVTPALTGEMLNDVFIASADDAWAVGPNSTVLRYQGGGWTLQPMTSLPGRWLMSVWGAEGEVWAVGLGRQILHYDGFGWANVSPSGGTLLDLASVWGSSPRNIWAVGDRGLRLHFDGTDWTEAAVGVNGQYLHALAGLGRSDVWAGGADGANGLVLRFH